MFKVSVIVPIYGVEAYIERCVRTLFSQTLTDIEYIFVDDCTPDSSITILKHLEEEYSDRLIKDNKVVKLYRMSENSGQAAVRKFAIQQATGDYIIHCDSDDWIETDMYKRMYEVASETTSDIVICDFYQSTCSEDKYIKACFNHEMPYLIYELMQGRGYWSLCNKLVRRSLYDQVRILPKDNMGEDMVIMLQLLHYSNRVSYIEKAYYHYFVNPTSIVRGNSEEKIIKKFTQVVNNVNIIEKFLIDKYSGLKFINSLDSLKLRQLNILLPLLKEKHYWKIWSTTFSSIKYRLWINPRVSWKNRLKYYLRLFRLYY